MTTQATTTSRPIGTIRRVAKTLAVSFDQQSAKRIQTT